MSTDLNVFVEKQKLLTPAQWQQRIESDGFPMKLDTSFDPDDFSGYLPATLNGEEVVFELDFSPLEDTMFDPEDDPELVPILGPRDLCVGFCIPAGAPEGSVDAAVMAAAVLARACDGVCWVDPEFCGTDELLQHAREAAGLQ